MKWVMGCLIVVLLIGCTTGNFGKDLYDYEIVQEQPVVFDDMTALVLDIRNNEGVDLEFEIIAKINDLEKVVNEKVSANSVMDDIAIGFDHIFEPGDSWEIRVRVV